MSFTERRKNFEPKMQESRTGFASAHTYTMDYFSHGHIERIRDLNDLFLLHFFEDISRLNIKINFDEYLGSKYRSINEDAKECTNTAFFVKDIVGAKICQWIVPALKCFDGIFLVLIQDKLGETITGDYKVGREREKYHYLIEKGNEFKSMGENMDKVYKARNELFHVEIIDINGKRDFKPISKKKYNFKRDAILDCMRKSIKYLVDYIEKEK